MKQLLKCEINKIITLKSLLSAFLLPLVMAIIGLINICTGVVKSNNILDSLYNQTCILYGGITLPICIIIIISMQWRIEYKHNNIINLYSSPINLGKIYISKIICTLILVTINIIILIFTLLIFSKIFLHIEKNYLYFIYAPLIGLLFSIPFILIQHLIAMLSKNFIFPIALGIILTFSGFILNSTKFGILFPHIYVYYGFFFNVPTFLNTSINKLFFIIPILTIISLFLGVNLFKTREI